MKCVDKNKSCLIRKQLGQCYTNPVGMREYCPQSCGVCQVPREVQESVNVLLLDCKRVIQNFILFQVNWVNCRDVCDGEGPCDKCGYHGRCCSGASGKEGKFQLGTRQKIVLVDWQVSGYCTLTVKRAILNEAKLFGYDRREFVCVTGRSIATKMTFCLLAFLSLMHIL